MNKINISKGDSKNTRNSKRKFNNKIKRIDKEFKGSLEVSKNKKGKYYNSRRVIKFTEGIEKFLTANYSIISSSSFTGPNNKLVIKLNTDFSLFENPGKVLLSLTKLLRNAKTLITSPKITYDGYISFGALYLLDNLCWEVAKKRKWIVEYNKFPDGERSILNNLRSMMSSTFEDENECMINEKVIIKRGLNADHSQQYRVKATEITDMVQKALRVSRGANFALPFEVHGAIKSAIGEQFDNILEHALESDIGTICCFYNKISQEITVLIYNFGNTIAETLTEKIISEELPFEISNNITDVISNHLKKKLFTFGSKFTVENALTLLAIQEGISSKLKVNESRGFGLMDFLGHCFELSMETKVSFISGSTAIKIDKKYPIGIANVFGRERRILAFNKENDIYEQPDSNYVRNIGVAFNGVLIETTIPLNLLP